MVETNLITALVITFNEQDNLARTLDSVAWADNILIIDSGSNDKTLKIAARYRNVRVVHRDFTTFAEQCNFGLSQVATNWVLSIDADYVFPEHSKTVIDTCLAKDTRVAYSAEFDYAIDGKIVRGSILPPRTVLYRKDKAHYVDDGHGHRVVIDDNAAGEQTGKLGLKVIHDDRKPLSRWLTAQCRYAVQETDKILNTEYAELSPQDKIRRRIVLAPLLVFILVYVVRGGFLSGWHGFYYACQRFFAEMLLSLFLIDRKITRRNTDETR